MSVIRKLKSSKWQVLIRKANQPHIIKSFFDKGRKSMLRLKFIIVINNFGNIFGVFTRIR